MEPRCEKASSNLTSTIKAPHVKTDRQILLTNCTISCVCAIWVSLESLFITIYQSMMQLYFLMLWGKCACANTLPPMLECSGWLLGACILAQSKETNSSSCISMHLNDTFLTGLMAQSDWKASCKNLNRSYWAWSEFNFFSILKEWCRPAIIQSIGKSITVNTWIWSCQLVSKIPCTCLLHVTYV